MKNYYLLAVAFALVPFMSGCHRSDDAEYSDDDKVVEEYVLPTEDQFYETCSFQAKIFGTVEQSDMVATAITRRMKNTVSDFDEENTKVCIVTNEVLVSDILKEDDYLQMYKCYENGGAIVVTNPTEAGFGNGLLTEIGAASFLQKCKIHEMKIDDVLVQFDEYIPKYLALTDPLRRAIGEDGTISVIVVSQDGYFTNKLQETTKATFEDLTAYECGLCSDRVVKWIEVHVSQSDEDAKSNLLLKAATKAGNININEASKPYVITETYPIKAYNRNDKNGYIEHGIFEQNIEVYLSHDVGARTDYYLINQNGTFHTSKLKPVPNYNDPEVWFYDAKEVNQIIRYFKQWQTSIGLGFAGGGVSVYKSEPQANNGSTTTTTSTATCQSTSQTNGFVVGGGGSASGPNVNASYNHTWTTGSSTTYTVGTSRSVQDISVVRTTPSDTKYDISWTYTGIDATWYKSYYAKKKYHPAWHVGKLQISDMTQSNSALYKVTDATTQNAKLRIKNSITYCESARPRQGWNETGALNHKTATIEHSKEISLPVPFRSVQKWTFNVEEYGNAATMQEKALITTYIMDYFLSKNAEFTVPDTNDESCDSAKEIMNLFLKNFNNWNAYNTKGKFVFSLRRQSDNKVITASCTK